MQMARIYRKQRAAYEYVKWEMKQNEKRTGGKGERGRKTGWIERKRKWLGQVDIPAVSRHSSDQVGRVDEAISGRVERRLMIRAVDASAPRRVRLTLELMLNVFLFLCGAGLRGTGV